MANYFKYSPLTSNLKHIEAVIGKKPNAAISNWFTIGSGQHSSPQSAFGSGGNSIIGNGMSYFGGSAYESNSRAGFSNLMPESTSAPFFDFNDAFSSMARQSDLDFSFGRSSTFEDRSHLMAQMHSLSVSSDKSISSPSSKGSSVYDTFAERRKVADSTTSGSTFGWNDGQDKEPNNEEPAAPMECGTGGGPRPILGRNAEYYAKYGINMFPEGVELPTEFKYSLDRRTPRFVDLNIKPVRVLKKECVFCKRLGKPNYDTHWLKTTQNVVTCPELRSYKCKLCGCQGGDKAHTYR